MKIKLDENLPDRLVAVLTGLGHNVDSVRTEQLTGRAGLTCGAPRKPPSVS